MSDLSDFAECAADAAGEANEFDEMGIDELITMALALKAARRADHTPRTSFV